MKADSIVVTLVDTTKHLVATIVAYESRTIFAKLAIVKYGRAYTTTPNVEDWAAKGEVEIIPGNPTRHPTAQELNEWATNQLRWLRACDNVLLNREFVAGEPFRFLPDGWEAEAQAVQARGFKQLHVSASFAFLAETNADLEKAFSAAAFLAKRKGLTSFTRAEEESRATLEAIGPHAGAKELIRGGF
jgi:hypothetical protein